MEKTILVIGNVGHGVSVATVAIIKSLSDKHGIDIVPVDAADLQDRGIIIKENAEFPYVINKLPDDIIPRIITKEPKNYINGKKLPKLKKHRK